MKLRTLVLAAALLWVMVSFRENASAYSTPLSWAEMEMLDITFKSGTNKLAIAPISGPALLGTNTTTSATDKWSNGLPSASGLARFDPTTPWAVLNGTAFSRRFGWNDAIYDWNNTPPTTSILITIRAFYGPGAKLWIESSNKSTGLNTYLAVGYHGVNADDTLIVDLLNPTGNPYSGIFGTAGSSTTWQWDGMMDHNVYAVPFSYLNAPHQLFSADYRIYVGDSSGNELLVDKNGNPVASAGTTTTWQWQGPAFVFTSQTGVPISTLVESDVFTLTGVAAGPQTIAITGGEYAISTDSGATWGAWTNAAGTIALNDKVKLRQPSGSGPGVTTTAILAISAVPGPGTFKVTTVDPDAVPEPFSFPPLTGVDPATIHESNAVTVTGVNTSAPITISSGGSYAISTDNGATWSAWTASAGTVSLHNQVKVRNTSSASPNTAVVTTLTIGSVTGNFSITTNAYTAPPTWMPMTMLNISLTNGKLAIVELANMTPFNTTPPTYPVLSTVAPDRTFDPTKPWAVLNGAAYSRRLGWNPAAGFNATAVQSAFGANAGIWIERISASPGLETFQAVGKYGVNANGATTVEPAANGYIPIFGAAGSSTKWKWDYLMDHNANAVPAAYITEANQHFSATYRIYVGDSATGADLAPDAAYTTTWGWTGPATVPGNIPDAFSFTSRTGVAVNTVIESNSITVSGLAVPALITITGGEYSVSSDGGATWSAYSTTTPAIIANSYQIKIRLTSASAQGVTTTATLTIGGVAGTFSVNSKFSGDVNSDNTVNVFDALLVLQYAVNLYQPPNDSVFRAAADVAPLESGKPKGDGAVNVFDALAILRHAVGLDVW